MKTLRKLASVLVLTLVLGLPAFAGQTDTDTLRATRARPNRYPAMPSNSAGQHGWSV